MAASTTSTTREFLIDKVLKNHSGILDRPSTERLALLRREKVSLPVIYIGMGTCGIIAGAEKTLHATQRYLKEAGIEAEVVPVGCLGLCSAEPLLDVQLPGKARISFRHISEDRVEAVLNSVFHRTIHEELVLGQFPGADQEVWPNVADIDKLPFFIRQQRVLLRHAGLISPGSIDEYLARGGYKSLYKTVLNYTADKVCEIIEQSELRGRGGGGYPTGKKWRVAYATGSDQKYLICNADESNPGAFMDRALIESNPHQVLEGVAIAAYAIGATSAVIYLRDEYSQPVRIIENALAQAKDYGFVGENIFGSGFNLSIQIRQGAGAFVCGEETALISSLEGRRGIPQAKPPFPAEKGLFGHPTIVNNVETLANVPSILENGPQWFRAIGTKESKGTKLFSLAGKSENTGLIEIAMGTRLRDVVDYIAGGVRNGKKLKALQMGGPSGVFISPGELETEVAYETITSTGAQIGLGGFILLDEDTCMVSLSSYFLHFLQKESCGKCIPCREGTKRMLEILEGITRRPREESTHETLERFKGVVQLEGLAEVIRDTSLCGLGQHAPNPVLSSLRWFRDEYEEHIFDRRCTAGVCKDLRTYVIDVDQCTGCNLCQKRCPEGAIVGAQKMPHFIVESKCTGCGICFDVCKFSAIFYK